MKKTINEMKTPHTAIVSDHSGQRPSIFASMMPIAIDPGVSMPAAI
jgi:hypothetical protein